MTAITGKPAKIYTAYFSPTGGTKKAALALTSALADTDGFTEIDLSLPALAQYTFAADDIIVVAVPVFGGRVPAFALQQLTALHGQNTSAIAVAAYGNRAYEDALLELSDSLTSQSFRVIAAAAVLSEHSMLRSVAAGRPDADDLAQLTDFAKKISAKPLTEAPALTNIPGNRPYKDWQPMPSYLRSAIPVSAVVFVRPPAQLRLSPAGSRTQLTPKNVSCACAALLSALSRPAHCLSRLRP